MTMSLLQPRLYAASMRPDHMLGQPRPHILHDMAGARHISVIIPFFQRSDGILRRAVQSVAAQQFPWPASLDLIIIDDGSPADPFLELVDLPLPSWLHLRIIGQPNAGPAAARNRGLDAVKAGTQFVAFLDSDDIWKPGHLAHGIDAMVQGHDFYFCDSALPTTTMFAELEEFRQWHGQTAFEALAGPGQLYHFANGRGRLPMLREYLCQTSSVILRHEAFQGLRFDEKLRHAGEDWLMWVRLAHRVESICFSREVNCVRGEGINLYRDAHDRLSVRNLNRILSMIRAYRLMSEIVGMARDGLCIIRVRMKLLEQEAAAILLHPRLYSSWRDPALFSAVVNTILRLSHRLPGHWMTIAARALRAKALPVLARQRASH
jgi:succinoglycan biosynthesis protein ExoW